MTVTSTPISSRPVDQQAPPPPAVPGEPELPTPRAISAPGPAIVLRARDATQTLGLVLDSEWGIGVAVSDGQTLLKELCFTFTASAGAYELWVEYAAAEIRPVTIFVDGAAAVLIALDKTSGGWMPQDHAWHRQCLLPLAAGEHTVTLKRGVGAFPHVRRLALLPIVTAEAEAPEPVAFERRTLLPLAEINQMIEECGNGSAGNAVLHAYLNALHPVDPDAARRLLARQGKALSIAAAPSYLAAVNIIDIDRLTPEMEQFTRACGISLNILRSIFTDTIGFGGPGGLLPVRTASEIEGINAIGQESLFLLRIPNYMHLFFQAGGLVAIDPLTGERVVSTHSFMFDHLHTAYRFAGLETFYIVIGGIGSLIRFMCVPRLNCAIIANVPGEGDDHRLWSLSLYHHLMMNLVMAGDRIAKVTQIPRHATGVALGFWPNLGHHIWQELSGLEEILNVNGPGAVRHLLLGPHLGLPVQELFPELADRPTATFKNPMEEFREILTLPYQYLRPVNVAMRPTLRARIFAVAERHVSADRQAFMREIAENNFLFWITLRAHNKIWLQQVSGYVAIVRKIAEEVESLAVLLDGWTDTREDADAIKALLPPNVKVIDTLGCSLFETFLWGRIVHLYAAVVSTGLHFPSHFGSRPGVAHGNVGHLIQKAFWNYLSPGTLPPVMLDPSEVKDASDGSLYDNYDFPPELLYRRLRELILKHYPDRIWRP